MRWHGGIGHTKVMQTTKARLVHQPPALQSVSLSRYLVFVNKIETWDISKAFLINIQSLNKNNENWTRDNDGVACQVLKLSFAKFHALRL